MKQNIKRMLVGALFLFGGVGILFGSIYIGMSSELGKWIIFCIYVIPLTLWVSYVFGLIILSDKEI